MSCSIPTRAARPPTARSSPNLIDKAYPGHDYDDLMSAVDAAIASGACRPQQSVRDRRIGRRRADRVDRRQDRPLPRGGDAEAGDRLGELCADQRRRRFFSPYWFAKKPWEDPTGYWARSPLSLVGNVKTPTLVVVGSEDYRTPDSEAEQYYAALQLRGVPTAFVKVPGASHGGIASRAESGGGKGQRDPRLVRPLPDRTAGQTAAATEGASQPAAH